MILSVEGIEFSYPSAPPVLNGVNFSMESGTVSAILGINGSGKSTLLKCTNRILRPAKGVVFLDETDLHELAQTQIAKHVGYVPQKCTDSRLTVFDTVLLGRKPYIKWAATKRDIEMAEHAVRMMKLEKFVLRPVSELSGGEMQKVIIARALAQEPDVLLLDEPTSNLDLKNQVEVMNLISEVARKKKVAVMISVHDLNLALRFADVFLLLKDGVIRECGGKESITPRIIREVYEVDVVLGEVGGYSVVIPVGQ